MPKAMDPEETLVIAVLGVVFAVLYLGWVRSG
jgi:ABC-type thiamin/hydroxymethylpyrimidine transport system permease subunit